MNQKVPEKYFLEILTQFWIILRHKTVLQMINLNYKINKSPDKKVLAKISWTKTTPKKMKEILDRLCTDYSIRHTVNSTVYLFTDSKLNIPVLEVILMKM